MNDAKDEDDSVLLEDVVHNPIVAHAQPVEGVRDALDSLGALSSYAAGFRNISCELLKDCSDPATKIRRELLESADSCGSKLDLAGLQARSLSWVVAPRACSARAWRRIRIYASAFASTRSSASSTGSRTAAGRPRLVTT